MLRRLACSITERSTRRHHARRQRRCFRLGGAPARATIAPSLRRRSAAGRSLPISVMAVIAVAATLAGCSPRTSPQDASRATPKAAIASTRAPPVRRPRIGIASWYRRGPHLHRTCSGAPLRNDQLTAASPSLPTGTRARVSLLHGHRSVIVEVTDCMPASDHRIIDLSVAAARRLRIIRRGIAEVRVTPISPQPIELSSR